MLKIISQASDRVRQVSRILWGQTTVTDSQHPFAAVATAPSFLHMDCLCLKQPAALLKHQARSQLGKEYK